MEARCGTRAAIIAHHEFGEALDGVCAAADVALRLESERVRPYKPGPAARDSAEVCAHRLEVLEAATLSWEAENPARRAVSRSAASGVSGRPGIPTQRATPDREQVSA